MPNPHNTILDRFLSSVPVEALDEAEQFVREVRFMCKHHIDNCPIVLYKAVPSEKQPTTFFRAKNRHRSLSTTGSILNQALQQERVFERGLDVEVTAEDPESCVVFLPDHFDVAFANVAIETFTESATLSDDTAQLASIVYKHDLSQLTEDAKHVIASNVPFYYCIRLK